MIRNRETVSGDVHVSFVPRLPDLPEATGEKLEFTRDDSVDDSRLSWPSTRRFEVVTWPDGTKTVRELK